MKAARSRHVPRVHPTTHVVTCGCGETWEGLGAADRATAHVEEATSREGRRDDRLWTLAGGKTTAQAADDWGLTKSGAFAYLRRLCARGLIRKTIIHPRAHWDLGR